MGALINDFKTWEAYQSLCKDPGRRKVYHPDFTCPDELKPLIFSETRHDVRTISHNAMKDFIILQCKASAPDYIVDEKNEPVIDQLIMWLRRDERFLKISPGYSFDKGLMIRGGVGSGKTLLFTAFEKLISKIVFWDFGKKTDYDYAPYFSNPIEYAPCIGKRFYPVTTNKISSDFSLDGFAIFEKDMDNRKTFHISNLLHGPIFFDDLGSENIANHYGASINIMSEIIIRRYEKKLLTHFTSNLSIEEIKAFYGMRVYDRLREMVNDTLLLGESRRK